MFWTVVVVFIVYFPVLNSGTGTSAWTSSAYPDIRGTSSDQCQANVPPDQLLYICDPDRVLNKSQTTWLNAMLHEVSQSTPCPCQRRSQCSGGSDSDALHGFIVSVAIVQNLQMTMHSPSELQLTDRAESFCRALEGKWALGDCGNSLIIFVWQHYKKMVIWPARLAERYVTVDERKAMLARVNSLAQMDDWYSALSEITTEIRRELNGDPETRVDTGTLSLVVSVGVAVALTVIITLCVCAFRCFGNLKNDDGSVAGRVDSLRNSIVRRGSSLRRSISRSPKFPPRDGHQPPAFFFSDTTIV